MNSDPAFPYRAFYGPVYPASKAALNAITLAMALRAWMLLLIDHVANKTLFLPAMALKFDHERVIAT